jgi:hypothetical protein
LAYVLLWLLVAATFLMPGAFVPELTTLPIFNCLILACLAASSTRVLGQLGRAELAGAPITVLVLGLLAAVALSHVSQGYFRYAYDSTWDFAKFVVFYLVLVANLSTPTRLRRFLPWMAVLVSILAASALLQYHGLAYLSEQLDPLEREQDFRAAAATADTATFRQLRGVGFFQDPNDVCLALVVTMFLAAFRIARPRAGLERVFWLVPLGLTLAAFPLTHSRGGFIALVVGLVAFVTMRFGWKRSLPVCAVIVPTLALAFGGRQTAISSSEGTAQQRIQLWVNGLSYFRARPLTGIGSGLHADFMGHDAHNSFVHAFVELGFLGGTCFLGIFAYALASLWRLGAEDADIEDDELARLRPYLGAIVASYLGGMLSLSRVYVMPTYLIAALAASYIRAADPDPPPPPLSPRLAWQLLGVALLFLIGAHAYVRAFARWGGA